MFSLRLTPSAAVFAAAPAAPPTSESVLLHFSTTRALKLEPTRGGGLGNGKGRSPNAMILATNWPRRRPHSQHPHTHAAASLPAKLNFRGVPARLPAFARCSSCSVDANTPESARRLAWSTPDRIDVHIYCLQNCCWQVVDNLLLASCCSWRTSRFGGTKHLHIRVR